MDCNFNYIFLSFSVYSDNGGLAVHTLIYEIFLKVVGLSFAEGIIKITKLNHL